MGSNPTLSATRIFRAFAVRPPRDSARAGGGKCRLLPAKLRRDVREAEGARLEIACTSKRRTEGSNPSLSATTRFHCVRPICVHRNQPEGRRAGACGREGFRSRGWCSARVLSNQPIRPSDCCEAMSYLVIARKWRPQTFDEVVGQPHVTRTLQNAIRSNRIAHSYLFTGARGVGKTSVARILAKAINCRNRAGADPCNECASCREITQGNSVDVLEIDGASNRGIDDIRELRETVLYRPARSPYKIYIVDEVHMLTEQAFNALLKTLEEPPEHVLFIFATTEPQKIPSTILSRCQRFDFRRLSTPQLAKHLKEIVRREGAGLSDALVYAAAREADGSMRDGQSLLEQLLAFSGDELTDEEILDVLGVVDLRSVRRAGKAILDGDVATCLDVVDDIYRRGIDSRRFCQQLCEYFRNLLFLAVDETGGGTRLDLPPDEIELLKGELTRTNRESLYLYFQTVMKGEDEIRRSSLPRVSLEMLLLRLAQLPRLESMQEAVEKLDRIEKLLAGGGAAPVLAESPPPFDARLPGKQKAPPKSREEPARAARVETPPPAAPAVSTAGEPVLEGPEPPPRGPWPDATGPEALPADVPVRDAGFNPPAASEVGARWNAFLEWLQNRDAMLAARLTRSTVQPVSESAVDVMVMDVFASAFSDAQTVASLGEAANSFFGVRFSWGVKVKSPDTAPGPEDAGGKKPKAGSKGAVLKHPVVIEALEVLGGELVEVRGPKKTRT